MTVNDHVSFPVYLKADTSATPRTIFLAPRSSRFSYFMCHHLHKCILPLMLSHFWTITFLFSRLFFPEFLIASFFLFGQRKLGLCHHVPILSSRFFLILCVSWIHYVLLDVFLLGTHGHFIGHHFLAKQLTSGLIPPFLVFSHYPFIALMFTPLFLEYILI